MKIPFFNLSRQNELLKEEILNKYAQILEKGDFIEGSFVKEFETTMAQYLGVKHVITCGNGTESLVIALKACGVKPGLEVITTSFSFIATSEAIALAGGTPVFVDIDPYTLNIDPKKIEEKITNKTVAILPVHIFGKAAEMDEVNAIAKKHNLKVVEDACQAIGAEYHDHKTGTLGDIAGFSFYPTKNLGGTGDGGMITTNDDDLAVACRALKSHGAGKMGAMANSIINQIPMEEMQVNEDGKDALYDPYKYYNFIIGSNSRLDSLQAASLLAKMPHLDTFNTNRAKIAKRYCEELKDLPIQVPIFSTQDCWHQFAVLVDNKDSFVSYMGENGIGTGAFYPVPLHLQKAFSDLEYEIGSLPIVEKVCKQSVCLPVFPELTKEEVTYIIKTVKTFFAKEEI